jgi:hypothetical protein
MTDTATYDALMRLMDQVEVVDKKVSRLLAAAGVDEDDVPALGETT